MKGLNRISALFLMSFAVLIGFGSIKLRIGTLGDMGPGFMPFFAAILLFLLSTLILLGIRRRYGDSRERSPVGWDRLLKPGSLIMGVCGYALFLEFFGYMVTTFLLMSHMLFISEPKKWSVNILIAAIASLVSFTGFRWLQVQLPIGAFHIGW